MLLLYSRLAPELVTGTVKKSKLLGATVLKHRADQQQTKSFVYIWCSSRPKIFVCCCSALCFTTLAPSSLLFLTVSVTSLGPSPQSSTPCQQILPCCPVCLVWLALGARKICYGWQVTGDRWLWTCDWWQVTRDPYCVTQDTLFLFFSHKKGGYSGCFVLVLLSEHHKRYSVSCMSTFIRGGLARSVLKHICNLVSESAIHPFVQISWKHLHSQTLRSRCITIFNGGNRSSNPLKKVRILHLVNHLFIISLENEINTYKFLLRLHLFYRIFHAIRINKSNFF